MKKITLSVLALATVASFTACKKGAEDGFLSLKSRKVRFAGEWTVTESTSAELTTYKNSNGTSTSDDKTTITGGTFTNVEDKKENSSSPFSPDRKITTDGTVSTYTYTIKKDGTWSSIKTIKVTKQTEVKEGASSPKVDDFNVTKMTETSGTWQFTKKNKGIEEKNKESVVLATTKVKTTTTEVDGADTDVIVREESYGVNEMVQVWHLTQLKSKAMIADGKIENANSGNQVINGGTPSVYSSSATSGTFSMTFKQ